MEDSLWHHVTGAQSKRPDLQDAPTQQSMRAGQKPADRRAPSSDQKKVRRQMAKQADTKESTMSEHTEADLLAKMASATTLAEQSEWAERLNDFRATRRDQIASEASIDFDAVLDAPSSFYGLPPVGASLGVSTDTDWLGEIAPREAASDADLSDTMRAEASLWFEALWEPIVHDEVEFATQARHAGLRAGSQFGLQAQAAASVFEAQAAHLRKRAFDEVQPGPYGVGSGSSLPAGVNNKDTFDQPEFPATNKGEDQTTKDVKSEAPSLAEGSEPAGDKADNSVDNPIPDGPNAHDKSQGTGYTDPLPTGGKGASVRTATEDPKSAPSMAPSLSEGDQPSGDSSGSAMDAVLTPEDHSSQGGDPDALNTGGTGNAATPASSSAPYTSSLSTIATGMRGREMDGLAVTFVTAMERLASVEDAYAGISGREIVAHVLATANPTEAEQRALYAHLNGEAVVDPFSREAGTAGGLTCETCGDKIAKDPKGEANSGYHHDNGEKHDHEAKPGGGYWSHDKAAAKASDHDEHDAGCSVRSGGFWCTCGHDSKESAKTASRYCTQHKVYVGDGNAATHTDCKVETRKSSSKTAGEIPESFKQNWDKGGDAKGGDDKKSDSGNPFAKKDDDEKSDSDKDDDSGKPWLNDDGSKKDAAKTAGDSVTVANIPECDVCKYEKGRPGTPAVYDGKTIRGPWANMCEDCFSSHGVGLGTGKGQRLVKSSAEQMKTCDNCKSKWTGGRESDKDQCPKCGHNNATGFTPKVRPDGDHNTKSSSLAVNAGFAARVQASLRSEAIAEGTKDECHCGGKIEFFDGQWMHLKGGGGTDHNDVHPLTPKEKADRAKTSAEEKRAKPGEIEHLQSGAYQRSKCQNCGDTIRRRNDMRSTWQHAKTNSKFCGEAKMSAHTAAHADCPDCGTRYEAETQERADDLLDKHRESENNSKGKTGAASHNRCDHRSGYCEVLRERSQHNPFSISDAKNEDGEWIMSPEQIRSEMAYERDPGDMQDDFYNDQY